MKDLSEPRNEGHQQRLFVSPARLAAFEILRRVDDGAYASVLLATKAEALSSADRALAHELVMGVLRWQLWLDSLTEYYSGRKTATLDLAVRIALRLGLYQLRFLTRIPASAAVNESVNLTRLGRLRSAASFVNAVLRRATREPEHNPATAAANPLERLAIETSHPIWLIDRWSKAFGLEETRALAAANNQAAPVAFRIVANRTTEPEVLGQLRDSGASLFASEIAKGAWRISGGGGRLRELSQTGQVYFQDEASQLVSEVLEVQSGDRVLDVCSAPGGKTTQIASSGAVKVVAADLHDHRLRTLTSTAKLQGLANIQPVVLDAREALPFSENCFDRVLVDAPCSGTGTLRHNPEIRWRISAEDIRNLSGLQKQLLVNASRLVRAGGRLVYSTCSVEPEENEKVVTDFLQQGDQFVQLDLRTKSSLTTASGAVRTWPQRDGADGFFIAAFERRVS